MTYGLQVTNGDGRTIINSDQEYRNTQLSSTATLTSTQSSRVNFDRNSNLVFARPNTTTSATKPYGAAISDLVVLPGSLGGTYSDQHWMTNYSAFQNPSTTYKYTELSNQTSPATPSEYGLEVFNSSGDTTLLMTEGFENSFDILFSGVATTSTTTFQNINWKTDTDIYVLMNNTLQRYTNFFVGQGSFELFIGYIFDTDGSLQYVQNYYITDINGQVSTTFFTAVSNNPYLVVRIKQ